MAGLCVLASTFEVSPLRVAVAANRKKSLEMAVVLLEDEKLLDVSFSIGFTVNLRVGESFLDIGIGVARLTVGRQLSVSS